MTSAIKTASHTAVIRHYILELIADNTLGQQSKLPAERALCERFGITRITLRQALLQLETEGLIYRQHHRGWFVSPPRILYDPTKNLSFTEFVQHQGRKPHNRLLSAQRLAANEWQCQSLELQTEQAEVYEIQRQRSVDGRPVMLEHLYINAELCPNLLECSLDASLTETLSQHYNLVISRSSVRLHPTALTEEQAQALDGAAGTPAVYVERTNYDQHGRVIEIDREFWRHDALEITASSQEPCSSTNTEPSLEGLIEQHQQLLSHYQRQVEALTHNQRSSEQQLAQLQQRIAKLEQN